MNCDEVEGCISAFADNEITGGREEDVKTHLKECGNCQKLYELELSTKKLVKSTAIESAPAGLRERILDSISNTASSDHDSERLIRPASRVWGFISRRSVAFSTAAAVIILIGLFAYVTGIFGGLKITPFIESVYAYHAGPSSVNCSIIGTCEQVQKELANALEKEIPVPNLDDIDFELEGANGDLEMEGRNSAVIRYNGNKSEISHFVICCMKVPIDKLPKVEGNPEYRYASRKGINIIFWRCNKTKTTRCVAGDCSKDDLLRVAEQIRRRSKAQAQ